MFSNDLAVRVVEARPVWQLLTEWPEAGALLDDGTRAAAAALAAGVPTLRDMRPMAAEPYYRPLGHRRAFYVQLASGVLAVKGSEPYALNFAESLDELAAGRVLLECRLGSATGDRTLTRAELTGLEKFPIFEGKIPGCLTLREALGDARAAAAFQRAYVARHGAPARVPMPLFVGRWPDSLADQVRAALRPRLADRAWEIVDAGVAELAVYVYAYPRVPYRLAHLPVPDARRGGELRPRLERVARQLDVRAAVDGWVGLLARMLALGFVPKDPSSLVTGDCVQAQNAVLDGGLADVEGIIATRRLDARALRDALRRTVHELAITVTRLLVGVATPSVDMRDRLPDVHALVWSALGARVAAERADDPRVSELLATPTDLAAALGKLFEESL
jgi:hypothetical protein